MSILDYIKIEFEFMNFKEKIRLLMAVIFLMIVGYLYINRG